jgi:hypothetical protein
MFCYLLFLNFLSQFFLYFQPKYVSVIDYETHEPIPYVSFIGVIDSKGGFSDKKGVIYYDDKPLQKYIISCTGYEADTVYFTVNEIQLKPKIIILPTVETFARKTKFKTIKLGNFKKITWNSFAAQNKFEFYTYVKNPDTTSIWQIKNIKIAVSAYSKKKYKSFKIRPFIKDIKRKLPNIDLLDNITLDVPKGQNSVTFEIPKYMILPKGGCFLGFETIGYTNESDEFIPYSDFIQKPDNEKVSINIPVVKADASSKSVWKVKNGKGWFGNPFEGNYAFAFGIEVYKN